MPAPVRTYSIDVPLPEDAPAIARIHVGGWREAYAHLLDESWFSEDAVARRTVQWTQWLTPGNPAHDEGVYRIGRDGCGTPIGLAASWPVRDELPVRDLELSLLYVDRAWWGTGLADSLVCSVIGDSPASLWVAEDNPRARRFYEKLGFAPDGTRQTEQQLGGIEDIRMVR
ncbi:N-acetyltransferase family protein [Brachybacterium sp. DNPG3]